MLFLLSCDVNDLADPEDSDEHDPPSSSLSVTADGDAFKDEEMSVGAPFFCRRYSSSRELKMLTVSHILCGMITV